MESDTVIKSLKRDVNNTMSQDEYEKIIKNNKKIGILWLVLPVSMLAGAMTLFAIIQFVASSMDGVNESPSVIFGILKIILSLIGVISVVLCIVGIPVGIVYLSKKQRFPGLKYDSRSGLGDTSQIPPEIKGWNWGAAGLTWIWGASHRVWISFLVFIPLVNFVVLIYLGIKGNELAWKADKWESVDTFLASQKKWTPWGVIFFILGIIFLFGFFSTNS